MIPSVSVGEILRLGALIVGLVILQMAVVSRIELFGVSGNLLVVVPIGAGFLAGPERGATAGFLAGLALDLLVSTPFGLTALVWALTGYGAGAAAAALARPTRATLVALALLGGVGAAAGFVGVGGLIGQDHLLDWRAVRIALVAGGVAAVAAVPLLPALRWATDEHLAPAHRRR